ncbi:MAG: hypothetical protein GDA50_01545 [Alphaproteobacteria bacterium GM202ARS2]|nr:hypothetical protein [Alphaproteobacteria bacterium GM202ARS2]
MTEPQVEPQVEPEVPETPAPPASQGAEPAVEAEAEAGAEPAPDPVTEAGADPAPEPVAEPEPAPALDSEESTTAVLADSADDTAPAAEPLLSPQQWESLRLDGVVELGRLSLDVAGLRSLSVGTRLTLEGDAQQVTLRVHGVVVARLRVVADGSGNDSGERGKTSFVITELGDGR